MSNGINRRMPGADLEAFKNLSREIGGEAKVSGHRYMYTSPYTRAVRQHAIAGFVDQMVKEDETARTAATVAFVGGAAAVTTGVLVATTQLAPAQGNLPMARLTPADSAPTEIVAKKLTPPANDPVFDAADAGAKDSFGRRDGKKVSIPGMLAYRFRQALGPTVTTPLEQQVQVPPHQPEGVNNAFRSGGGPGVVAGWHGAEWQEVSGNGAPTKVTGEWRYGTNVAKDLPHFQPVLDGGALRAPPIE